MILCAMPVDCQLYFGASPPLIRNNSFKERNFRLVNNVRNRLQKMPLTLPLRPILIMRHDTDQVVTSPTTKLKKRVMFADEKGNPLTEIKFMSEPSNFPPQWNDDFVEQVTKGASATAVVSSDKWEPLFTQPISDYVAFRTRLEEKCVCVENVIIKQIEEEVMGTIKVRNLSYDKHVFVRITFNSWVSHEDVVATHVPSPTAGTSVYELFDTFSFDFKISSQAAKGQSIEFCVCFQCNGREYWDNNNGANYKMILTPGFNESKAGNTMKMFQYEDALKAQVEHWTEFASWHHLVNDTPYW